MATLLGSTGDPGNDRYQGYAYDCIFAIPLTLPAGGPWRIVTLGARLAGDSTHFSAPTVYLMIWNSSGTLLGNSASFVPTMRAYPESDVYEKAVTSPPIIAGGSTVYVGFGFVWASGKGIQFESDYGVTSYSTANHTVPGALSSKYSETSGKPVAWLYYEAANQAPNTPSSLSPTGGALVGLTPNIDFTASDPDSGDHCTEYDIQVSTDSTFASVTHWNLAQTGINDATPHAYSIPYAGSALSRGSTYYWRARTKDTAGLYGPWTAAQQFKVRSVPTVTLTEPSAAGRLGRLAYTPGAGWATPRLYPSWSFSCPDGGTQASYELEVANDVAGNPSGFLYQSGTVNGTAGELVVPAGLTDGNYYHVHVRATCSHGEVSSWAGYYRTRTRWGLTTHRRDLTSAPASWAISNLATTTPAGTAIDVEYNSSPDGTTLGTWRAALADVPVQRWFHYRVFMRAWGASPVTSPSFDNLTLSYSQIVLSPDNWFRQDSVNSFATTESYVYGTQSLKMLVTTGNPIFNVYQDVTVLPNTDYILSGRIKSLGNSGARLMFGVAPYTDLTATDAIVATQDWQRVATPVWNSGTNTSVRVFAYVNGANGAAAWFDALKLEASRVVTPWQPGYVGKGAIIDAGGIQIDASDGGIFRLRGSNGGTRDRVDLSPHGLKFGGDTELLSPAAGILKIDTATADQALRIGDDSELRDVDIADRLGIVGQQDPTAGGLIFGSGKDTNLYRAGADILKTDDVLEADGNARASSFVTANLTLTTINTWYKATLNGTVPFTPKYTGQRFLVLWSGAAYTSHTHAYYVGARIDNDTSGTPNAQSWVGVHIVNAGAASQYLPFGGAAIFVAAAGDVGNTRYAYLYFEDTNDGGAVITIYGGAYYATRIEVIALP